MKRKCQNGVETQVRHHFHLQKLTTLAVVVKTDPKAVIKVFCFLFLQCFLVFLRPCIMSMIVGVTGVVLF